MADFKKFIPTKRVMKGAKRLLIEHSLPLDEVSFLSCLLECGYIEEREYISTTGTGEIKNFIAISENHPDIGMNLKNNFHPIKTEPRFYEDRFIDLYLIACEYATLQGQRKRNLK
jgi:hypothetical protein